MATKKSKLKTTLHIDRTSLLVKASGKEGQHSPTVYTGTGSHKNKKAYDRKKEKASLRNNDGDALLVTSSPQK